MDKENDLIHIAGIPTKRSDARIIINQAELAVRDLELSTDRAFAKYYFCLGWQAAIASQEATINTLNDAIIEDKILAEINAKLQAEIASQQDENNKLKIQIELLKQSAMASIQAIMDSKSK